ncbi:spore protein [Halalkalibacter okhensis]|nr:spore protein [Halalkalibacter okhensis]
MNKERKRNNEMNTADKTKEQRKQGYTGDKKLGGPNRPAE